jgi:hypothetical protein
MKRIFTLAFLFYIVWLPLTAQNSSVSGNVSDAQTNEPLIGVVVTTLPVNKGTMELSPCQPQLATP